MAFKDDEMLGFIDRARARLGFLSIEDVFRLSERNHILDPYSVLISRGAVIGDENVLYSNVVLQHTGEGGLQVGSRNVFFPGFLALAHDGEIKIGDDNQFGDGSISLKANVLGSRIVVGNGGRYMNGVTVVGRTILGSGSQVLGGPITIQDCLLEAGDSFAGMDPDGRAGVIKGCGVARSLRVGRGEVINGPGGALSNAMIERQLSYHPRPTEKDGE